MQFNFNVATLTTTGFTYSPTNLTIYVGSLIPNASPSTTSPQLINVSTRLVQELSNGRIIEEKSYQFPTSFLNAINGFDIATMAPSVDIPGMNAILANFGLILT